MEAIAKCPKCKKTITTDCEGCVSGGLDEHHGCTKDDIVNNINWKVIDCTKEEAETLKRLGFKGKIPEILN